MAGSLRVIPQKEVKREGIDEGYQKQGRESGHASWEDLVEEEEEEHDVAGVSGDSLMGINVILGDQEEQRVIIDCGATYSCINKELYQILSEKNKILGELPVINLKLGVAVGKRMVVVRQQVMVEMIWNSKVYLVVMLVVEGLFLPVILGLNWLRENKILIDSGRNMVYEQCNGVENTETKREREEGGETKRSDYKGDALGIVAGIKNKRRLAEKIKDEQKADDKWKIIISKMGSQTGKVYKGKEYCKHGGVLFLKKPETRNNWVLCIPGQEIKRVLEEYHDNRLHPGINKMYMMLKNLVTWTGMSRAIVENKGILRGQIVPLRGTLDGSQTGVMGAGYSEDNIVEREENGKIYRRNIAEDKSNKEEKTRDLKDLNEKKENKWRSQKEKWQEK